MDYQLKRVGRNPDHGVHGKMTSRKTIQKMRDENASRNVAYKVVSDKLAKAFHAVVEFEGPPYNDLCKGIESLMLTTANNSR